MWYATGMNPSHRMMLTHRCMRALASACLAIGCGGTPAARSTSETPAAPTPVGKPGVQGHVIRLEGNFMPPIEQGYKGVQTPVVCRVFIFRGKVKPFVQPDPAHPSLVAVVNTDSAGVYRAELEPGVYTAVAELDGKLYYNGISSDGNWESFDVTPGQVKDWPIIDNSRATY